jgi:molecular chaperone GrpE
MDKKNKQNDGDKIQEEQVVEETVKSENEEVEKIQKQVEDFENKYKRALADYQNLQKRVNEERQDWIRLANRELLLRFLPVLDTLILANQHVQNEGLQVSINQFQDVLRAEGVVRIETVGKDFDPHIMECVVTDKGEENKVLEELRSGYIMNDRVLRPAQVKVGKE